MKPLSINVGGDLRRNLSTRVYRIACAFANCIHTRVCVRTDDNYAVQLYGQDIS